MTGCKYIKLRMVGEDCEEMHFDVKKTTPLNKLMRRYSESKGVPVTSLRFFFDGFRIGNAHTAEEVGLEANDKIEVYTGLGGYTRWVECSCTMFLCACCRDAGDVVDLTENDETEDFTGLGGNTR